MSLQKQAIVSKVVKENSKKLLFASFDGDVKTVDRLLRKGKVDVNLPHDDGCRPIHAAAQEGHANVASRLLTKGKADPNIQANDGAAPLYTASKNGRRKIVKMLIKFKANVDIPFILYGVSIPPVYIAAYKGHRRIVKCLLRATKNVELLDQQLPTLDSSFPIPDAIKKQLKLHACSNPACPKIRQLHEPKFNKCSGCMDARYCSVDCQRAHWKNGHKPECKAMGKKQ